MNNYWETNYKASQPGRAAFRYSIFPHESFDPLQAEKRGIEIHQPLVAVITDRFMPDQRMDFNTIEAAEMIIESMVPVEGKGIVVRIFNPGMSKSVVSFNRDNGKKNIYLCDPFGNHHELIEENLEIDAREVMHVLIDE
jgi:hypothetical protein